MVWGFAQILAARGGKSLVTLWALIAASLLMTPVVTWLFNRDELLGNFIFSLFVAAVLANISNIIVGISRNPGIGVARVIWVVLCTVALILVISVTDSGRPDTVKDAGTVLAYLMLTLSFPIGFLGVILLIGLGQIINLGETWPYMPNLVAWLLFVVLGYLQWFVLLPYLIKRITGIKT